MRYRLVGSTRRSSVRAPLLQLGGIRTLGSPSRAQDGMKLAATVRSLARARSHASKSALDILGTPLVSPRNGAITSSIPTTGFSRGNLAPIVDEQTGNSLPIFGGVPGRRWRTPAPWPATVSHRGPVAFLPPIRNRPGQITQVEAFEKHLVHPSVSVREQFIGHSAGSQSGLGRLPTLSPQSTHQ